MSSSAVSSNPLVFNLVLCNAKVQNPSNQAGLDDFPEPPLAEFLAQISDIPEPPTAEELAALEFPEPPITQAGAAKSEKKSKNGKIGITLLLIILLLPVIAVGLGVFFLIKLGTIIVFLICWAIFCMKLWF